MAQVEAKLNITLHARQIEVHENLKRYTVIKAGKRFGKSYWAIYELLKAAGNKPGGSFWYVAPTYKQAKSIAWQLIKMILPKQYIVRSVENDLFIELVNGSRIELKGADNVDSLRGIALDGVIFDEAAYIDPYLWTTIIRGQLIGTKGFAYFISSPNASGKNWYSSFCESAEKSMLEGDEEWAYFHFSIYDNPTLPVAEIEKLKEAQPDENTWNVEYMGIESDFAGRLYDAFGRDRHVGEMALPTDNHYTVRGIDWGIAHPTVCLWATFSLNERLSPDNPVYIYDEFVATDLVIMESARKIIDKTGMREIVWTVIDPSTKKRNSQTLRTDADEFARYGVLTVAGDNKDRGYDIVRKFLKYDMVKVHPKCKKLIFELLNLQRGDKENDDACLVAGTEVFCKDGIKPIETVTTDDMVLTRNGYKRVLASGMTKSDATVYKLTTRNGKTLIGTINHPIFMKDGSTKFMGELVKGDAIVDLGFRHMIQYGIWKLSYYLQRSKSSTGLGFTGWAANISNGVTRTTEGLFCYIGKCGNTITERFLQNITSTILTRTSATTRFQTSPAYPDSITCLTTQGSQNTSKERGSTSERFVSLLQKSGIVQKKEELGTLFTQKKLGSLSLGTKKTVNSAIEFTKLLIQKGLNFVTSTAKWLIFTQEPSVVEVKLLPTKLPVYNLTVEENHEFFANGILTHNCDSLRYMLVRIHDATFNGTIFNDIATEKSNRKPNELDMNAIFKEADRNNNNDWILEEAV